jgi:hypothetical protein
MITIHKCHIVFLLLVCLGAALSGCSGPPSASEGRQAIEDRIKGQSEGRIRLVQFQKTNGQSAEAMGVKVYTLEYETEVEFLEACKWNIITFAGAIMDNEVSFRTTKSPDKPLSELAQLSESATNPGTAVSKGQRFKLVGAIRFEKKEKGWWVDGVKVTSITPLTGSANSSAAQPDRAPEHQAAGTSKTLASAASECREKAEKGDANAQFELARMYARGQGVETNMVEAMKWGRAAAEGGHSTAQLILGKNYLMGENVEQDYGEAEKWLRKAAEQNVAEAQLHLGYMYANGNGLPQNREMAVGLLQKVAASGSEFAEVARVRLGQLDPAKTASRACINNLKQIGLWLRTWGIDHDGDFPFNASTNRGGTKEFCSLGGDGFDRNAFVHFMVMSNGLVTPKLLVCPADSSKHPAGDFQSLQADNVTYQMRSGANISETTPDEVVARCPIHGHVLKCDGSVQSPKQ